MLVQISKIIPTNEQNYKHLFKKKTLTIKTMNLIMIIISSSFLLLLLLLSTVHCFFIDSQTNASGPMMTFHNPMKLWFQNEI